MDLHHRMSLPAALPTQTSNLTQLPFLICPERHFTNILPYIASRHLSCDYSRTPCHNYPIQLLLPLSSLQHDP